MFDPRQFEITLTSYLHGVFQIRAPNASIMIKRTLALTLLPLTIGILSTQAKAADNGRESLALAEQQPGKSSSEKLAKSLTLLAWALQTGNQLPQAEADCIKALELREKATPSDEFGIAESLARLAEIYLLEQQYAKAESTAARVLQIDQRRYGPNSTYMLSSVGALGSVYLAENKVDLATPLFERLVGIGQISKRIAGRDVQKVATSAADFYRKIGRDVLAADLETLAGNQTMRIMAITNVVPQPDEPAFSLTAQLRNATNLFAPIHVTPPPDGIIKIGHAAPLTGPLSDFGRDSEHGAQLAIEELNASHVVIGGKPIQFELVSKDDGALPDTAVDTARELIAQGISGVVGDLTSGAALNTARVYNSRNVVQITPSATNPVLRELGYATAFRMSADNTSIATLLGQYVNEKIKLSRIVLIDGGRGYSVAVADAFTKPMLAKNVKIADRISLLPIQKYNFSSEVNRIKAINPDLVFFSGMDSTAGPLLTQLHQAGVNPTFVGMDGICTEGLAALVDNVEKVICAKGNGIERESSKSARDFMVKFQRRFSEPAQTLGPYSYDAVKLMVAAMQQADSTDPLVFSKTMHSFNYTGAAGSYQFDENGDPQYPTIAVYGFRDGKKYLKNGYAGR